MSSEGSSRFLRIGTWNTNWAEPDRARGERVRNALARPDCDILCVTEGFEGILSDEGNVIDGGPDWGYPIDEGQEGRRKVLLWSKRPWSSVDCRGSDDLPNGRFVAGVTQTSLGEITVVGVCIPWAGAHVDTGRKDRRRWEEHEAWLSAFQRLPYRHAVGKTVVLGDFNQRIPRSHAPMRVHRVLMRAFDGLSIATKGSSGGEPKLLRDYGCILDLSQPVLVRAIDHIAHTKDLTPDCLGIWPDRSPRGEPLSDHIGVWGDFFLR